MQKKNKKNANEKKYFTLLLFVILLLSFGCNNKSKRLKEEYSTFINKDIKLPAFTKGVYKNKDTIYFHNDDVMARMVIFFDSTTCSSCQIARIWEWERVTSYAKVMRDRFEPIFIFAPTIQQEYATILSLKAQLFKCPIYVDTQQSFLTYNEGFPQNKIFHVFLMDKNNKVLLVGEPTYNSKLWEMYKTTITELIENDGTLPITKK